jgi:nucleoside-triphosphatase THEP1
MKNKIILITGEQGSGKTIFLKEIIKYLRLNGTTIHGILAEGFWLNGMRERYELVDLSTNERIIFCQRNFYRGWEKILHFYVNPTAVRFGEMAINPLNFSKPDIIAIDEIGPFELQGNGWSHVVNNIITESPYQPMIWVVRKKLVEIVVSHFNIKTYLAIDFDKYDARDASIKILNFVSGNSK